MEQNRVANVTKSGTTTVARKKASAELVLAAHLNQAREQIIVLRKQLVEQEQIIAQLQNQVAFLEIQNITKENEKLRDEHGLRLGAQLVQDNGEWYLVEGQPPKAD